MEQLFTLDDVNGSQVDGSLLFSGSSETILGVSGGDVLGAGVSLDYDSESKETTTTIESNFGLFYHKSQTTKDAEVIKILVTFLAFL